ncbi:response regulator transcription factor [Mesorhizobium marinum]|uniref:Response regulator transcription factor n=1 Tax=Mesorhizobium marinum TaxID=3228790 RepID=A0ABV3QZM4_9HYPH
MVGRPVIALICLAPQLDDGLADYLERRGYDVREASEQWRSQSLLSAGDIDVAVIGENYPASGYPDLLRQHAGEGGPSFVMVSSNADLIEKVLALELGAADIVPSPVGKRELAARIGGIVGRRGKGQRDLIVLENATVDLKAALVMHSSGNEEQLSPGQVALLRLFLANPRKVLTRDDIMAAAPAESADAFDRSIDSRIVRLRRKLDTESIATIRGAGYRFDPPQTQGQAARNPSTQT